MPKQKPRPPNKSVKRLGRDDQDEADARSRNPVNFVLDAKEHTRIVAECRQIEQASGLPQLTVGRYAKHALLLHRRLRSIESQVRSLAMEVKKAGMDRIDARTLHQSLTAILETSVAG